MKDKDRGGQQDQIEAHSLPGTNQAGKGPGSSEEDCAENKPGGEMAELEEELEDHSLPGTNQAGKRRGSSSWDQSD